MQPAQSMSKYVLKYQEQYYQLNKAQSIIGSAPNSDIRIENNPHVYPMHVQVIIYEGKVFLQSAVKSAGIWVNGSPASQQQILQDQDEIILGDGSTRLTLLLNRASTGAEQQIVRVAPAQQAGVSNLQSRQNTGAYAAQNVGGMQGVNAYATGGQKAFMAQQQQTPMIAMSDTATATTRYLCAAGHLDENFQDDVMRSIMYEERKALGESYGVDMPAVVSWCKAGLQRINTRDWLLTIFIILVVFGSFLINALISSILANMFFFSYMIQGIVQFLSGSSIIVAIVVVPIAFSIEKWLKNRWPRSYPGIISYLILFGLFGPFIVPLVWLTIFIELILRFYGEPTNHLRKNTFNPQYRPVPLEPEMEAKLRENFVTGQRNVIAYSGYEPFAGAGYYKGGWSFVVDTSKGAPKPGSSPLERLQAQPFTISSLYDAVERDVRALGLKNVLEIEGKLYVRGQYLPEHATFFNTAATRPVTNVDPSIVKQYKEQPTEDIRYYQCLRFNFWRGEMIFTAFLRFVQRGKELFTEVDYLLLPPMKQEYYWVDERELTPRISKIWQLYKRSFDAPISLWFGAPFRLLRGYFYSRQQRKLAGIALNNPAFDYGASTSLRQSASDDEYHLFFQKLDEAMYLKIIEKQIMETTVTFLEAHQIDTDELIQRQQNILNNTTNNLSGEFNVGAMSFGSNGHATNHGNQSQQSSAPAKTA